MMTFPSIGRSGAPAVPIMLLCRFLRRLQEPSTGAETFGVLLRIKGIELKLLNVAIPEL